MNETSLNSESEIVFQKKVRSSRGLEIEFERGADISGADVGGGDTRAEIEKGAAPERRSVEFRVGQN